MGNDIERPQGLTLVLKFSTRKYALADLMGIKVVQTKVIVVFFLKQSLPEFKLRGRGVSLALAAPHDANCIACIAAA